MSLEIWIGRDGELYKISDGRNSDVQLCINIKNSTVTHVHSYTSQAKQQIPQRCSLEAYPSSRVFFSHIHQQGYQELHLSLLLFIHINITINIQLLKFIYLQRTKVRM
jgi:hypothetical protein